MKPFIVVWMAVVAVNLLELAAAKKTSNTHVLFEILTLLALTAAGLVMAFFMHLKYERRSLVLSLIPALVFVLFMTIEMFPDSRRFRTMHPEFEPAGEQPTAQQ